MKETPSDLAYGLYAHDNAPRPAGYINTAGGLVGVPGTTALARNAWTHLAATYDGAILRLYVNGTPVGTRTTTQTMLSSTSPLRLGGNSVWGEYFQGRIDEVRIYNRALSQIEVQERMNTPVEPPLTAALTVSKTGTGTGTVTSAPTGVSCGTDCSESYPLNTGVALTATPAAGSTFAGWSGACTGTGSCSVSMTQARTVTATFTAVTAGNGLGLPVASMRAAGPHWRTSGQRAAGIISGATWTVARYGNGLSFGGVNDQSPRDT
jgi:uncharacterized repeat protein (TIGR02543 family)